MKFRSALLVSLATALLCSSLTGCATPKEGGIRRESWGTYSAGTATYMYAGMWAGLALQEFPDVAIAAEATAGTRENLELLRRGEAIFGSCSPERPYSAYHSIGEYAGQQPLTSIGPMWSWTQQSCWLFTLDPQITSFFDLAGKKVVLGPAGSANEYKNALVLEAHGYTRTEPGAFQFKELQAFTMSWPEAANGLAEGTIDAAICLQSDPEPSFFELSVQLPLRVIGISQDMYDKVLGIYQFLWPMTLPAGVYSGQNQNLTTLGDVSMIIGHTELLSDEDAYRFTKATAEKFMPLMAEQFDFLKIYVSYPQAMVAGWPIPGHPGAVKYWKEVGYL